MASIKTTLAEIRQYPKNSKGQMRAHRVEASEVFAALRSKDPKRIKRALQAWETATTSYGSGGRKIRM